MDIQYICKNCGWKGDEKTVVFDKVETCMGEDTIEICPECNSIEVVVKYDTMNKGEKKIPKSHKKAI